MLARFLERQRAKRDGAKFWKWIKPLPAVYRIAIVKYRLAHLPAHSLQDELLWEAFIVCERKILPDAGGLRQQSGRLMETFRLLDQKLALVEYLFELEVEKEDTWKITRGKKKPDILNGDQPQT